jgi:hypothetical protein
MIDPMSAARAEQLAHALLDDSPGRLRGALVAAALLAFGAVAGAYLAMRLVL